MKRYRRRAFIPLTGMRYELMGKGGVWDVLLLLFMMKKTVIYLGPGFGFGVLGAP